MSSTLIPTYSVTQVNNEVARHISESVRSALMTTSDDTANLAIALHPLVVATLRDYGLDGPGNRFNLGATSAERVAKHLTYQLQAAAEHEKAAAVWMSNWRKEFNDLVVTPVELVKRQRSGSQILDI